MPDSPLSLVEFPADDPERARRFWTQLLGIELQSRSRDQGEGWQTAGAAPPSACTRAAVARATLSPCPISVVRDIEAALVRVEALGGTVVHPGERWAICKDSEGSPFGLASESP